MPVESRCKTEKILINLGAISGPCPHKETCAANLDGDYCKLALACDRRDRSRREPARTNTLYFGQDSEKEYPLK